MIKKNKKKINQDVRNLVLARIKAASKSDLNVVVGDTTQNKADIIKSIEEESDAGNRIIEAQMDFLKAMAKGDIYLDA